MPELVPEEAPKAGLVTVRGLPSRATAAQVACGLLADFGVSEADVCMLPGSSESQGAVVAFRDLELAQTAIRRLDGEQLRGGRINLALASAEDEMEAAAAAGAAATPAAQASGAKRGREEDDLGKAWKKCASRHGTEFYTNSVTGEMCWEKPAGFEAVCSGDSLWEECSSSYGSKYYKHRLTGEMVWEKPDDFVGDSPGEEAAGGVPTAGVDVKPGDWKCPGCGLNVFARRFECFKCNTPKPVLKLWEKCDSVTGSEYFRNRVTGEMVWEAPTDVDADFTGGALDARDGIRPGDWICPGCGLNVFAKKTECFKCKTPRPGMDGTDSGGVEKLWEECISSLGSTYYKNRSTGEMVWEKPSGFDSATVGTGLKASGEVKPGDWTCPGCGINVFAYKIECFKCKTPKPGKVCSNPVHGEKRWEECTSSLGSKYYKNLATGEMVWEKPADFDSGGSGEDIWEKCTSQYGSEYFKNRLTGETVWERPM